MKTATFTRTSERSFKFKVIHASNWISVGNLCEDSEVKTYTRLRRLIRDYRAIGYLVRTHGFGKVYIP